MQNIRVCLLDLLKESNPHWGFGFIQDELYALCMDVKKLDFPLVYPDPIKVIIVDKQMHLCFKGETIYFCIYAK